MSPPTRACRDVDKECDASALLPVRLPPARRADAATFSWRALLSHVGPGFLIAAGYLDPANIESDLLAGARYRYALLWVLLWSTAAGLLLQSLAVRLALATGMHLARACRDEYPRRMRCLLWLLTEAAVVASDVPEIIGTAFALKMLLNMPLAAGVLVTALDALAFLALTRLGVRALEGFFGALIAALGACWLLEFIRADVEEAALLTGLALPRVSSGGAAYVAVSLLGAVVMPHNLYLHSGIVLSRRPAAASEAATRLAILYNTLESAAALLLSLLINVAVVAVGAAAMSNLPVDERNALLRAPLQSAPRLLLTTLGRGANTVFALALLASGQSSTMSGTYAGQFVVEGFWAMKLSPAWRAAITRTLAIGPALAAALLAGADGAERLIVTCSVLLSVQLPFALVPLLKFCSSPTLMGPHVAGPRLTRTAVALTATIVAANLVLVLATLAPGAVARGALTTCTLLLAVCAYLGLLAYLAWRPVTQTQPPAEAVAELACGTDDGVGGEECSTAEEAAPGDATSAVPSRAPGCVDVTTRT